MLRIFSSLSFLYAFVILVLVFYGWIYYRDFIGGKYQRRRFPIVFLLIGLACFSFLWINIHAPLKLRTFSNLEHHFLRHDGFIATGPLELGTTDTANRPGENYNSFVFRRTSGALSVESNYSEEPIYMLAENGYRLLSANKTAQQHTLKFTSASQSVELSVPDADNIKMRIGATEFVKPLQIRKGSPVWNIFLDDDAFIRSPYFNEPQIVASLKQVFLLRDDVSRKKAGELKYFISGAILTNASGLSYDGQALTAASLHFTANIPDAARIAWGIGFLDNNRNQFRVKFGGRDSFFLFNQYPVSYPLAEEEKDNWSEHGVSKFLVASGKDLASMPPVFTEGFLFPSYNGQASGGFDRVLLSYQKRKSEAGLQLEARKMTGSGRPLDIRDDKLILPSRTAGVSWCFSLVDSYDWQFGSTTMTSSEWKALLFGSLLFFFLLVWLTSLVKPAVKQNWIWQILSCVCLVLLSTRFFLYWRYKSFPPYEGMDLPSQQQLQSLANFGIILLACAILGIIFGSGFLRFVFDQIRRQWARWNKRTYQPMQGNAVGRFFSARTVTKMFPQLQSLNKKLVFFLTWFLLLLISGAAAAVNHFDPSVCRHIAIAFVIIYFIYLYFSYRFSPLVSDATKSWWQIGSRGGLNLIISNPVKILLSVSLLALFVFIDIGFAIVFLNFLLFNEAFLCINYGIAGLSAGSKRSARIFGILGAVYLAAFVFNLLYAPYIFRFLLDLPKLLYVAGYACFAISLAYVVVRLLGKQPAGRRSIAGIGVALAIFTLAFFFFPKERILEKAAMTKYRIDVLTTPVDKAISTAYEEGKTYEPVIRAAQNQWFINTFIFEENNPAVQSIGFTLLPHAPQNKGAKYNAQATDLVASRFLVGEHGKLAVLLYVFLLLLPTTMLASFYKLYPDFTNRINNNYPNITAGFSILNYLLITALLVVLAATGRYIFFGQDLPFGSILSKQSIVFPTLLLLTTIIIFRKIPLEFYANRRKLIPGMLVFVLLVVLLFFVKPVFNKNKEFGVAELAGQMDEFIQSRMQPLMDHFDTSRLTRRLPIAKKDALFADSIRSLIDLGLLAGENKFYQAELNSYARTAFVRHVDQRRLLYLDISSGRPQLEVNENYFRVEAPPHLQALWKGNLYSDTAVYHVNAWAGSGKLITAVFRNGSQFNRAELGDGLKLEAREVAGKGLQVYLHNDARDQRLIHRGSTTVEFKGNDSLLLGNPTHVLVAKEDGTEELLLDIRPDAFMNNYYVNGSRYYVYPMANDFIWARNFSEAISSDYTAKTSIEKNAFVSLDFGLMDSLQDKIKRTLGADTAYKKGAEYGICIADGEGRLLALNDYIKGVNRPDPNDKAAFNKVLNGKDGIISQSLLRKQIGNINLLRLNPGPGSTLKPIVFSAIASQLNIDWDAFETEGFTEKQHFYAGAKVAEYDFEKNNGVINRVTDYLKYSDNYYHSNVLLLGSYPKQALQPLLSSKFTMERPGTDFSWPYFNYQGHRYWMSGFKNWPAFEEGKAYFGTDSSFTSIGLNQNFNIYTKSPERNFNMLQSSYDSALFINAGRKSGFILPENALFDQQGDGIDHHIPYDLFTACFRGHVKGSSQVRIPPARMVEALGKMTSQNRNYALTLNPYALKPNLLPFYVDKDISYNAYLSIIKENVFAGMHEAIFAGTAARLGNMLEDASPYYYYGKTGTTGDDEAKTKSKLFTIIISKKDLSDPDFNFRNNKFYTIYFTSQNGPAKQNEEFQAEVIRFVESSARFIQYMSDIK